MIINLTPLRRYVFFDHKARWANDTICMVLALSWCVLRYCLFFISETRALSEASLIIISGTIISTIYYCFKAPFREDTEDQKPNSRFFLPGCLVASAFAAVPITLPAILGDHLDEQVTEALRSPVTTENLEKTNSLIKDAQEHHIRLPAESIDRVGATLVRVAAEQPKLAGNVLTTTAALATYKSHLAGPVASVVRASEERRVAEPDLQANIVLFGNDQEQGGALWASLLPRSTSATPRFIPEIPPVREAIIQVQSDQNAIDLDGVHARNLVFENATILYTGGPLKLESVRFVKCKFAVSSKDQKSQGNLNRFLAAALTGDAVTIDQKSPRS